MPTPTPTGTDANRRAFVSVNLMQSMLAPVRPGCGAPRAVGGECAVHVLLHFERAE
jgi:hypothetical protein